MIEGRAEKILIMEVELTAEIVDELEMYNVMERK